MKILDAEKTPDFAWTSLFLQADQVKNTVILNIQLIKIWHNRGDNSTSKTLKADPNVLQLLTLEIVADVSKTKVY